MCEKYTDLRTLPNGTKFRVENGNWYGYIFEKNGKKYIHINKTCEEFLVTGKEDLVITIWGKRI